MDRISEVFTIANRALDRANSRVKDFFYGKQEIFPKDVNNQTKNALRFEQGSIISHTNGDIATSQMEEIVTPDFFEDQYGYIDRRLDETTFPEIDKALQKKWSYAICAIAIYDAATFKGVEFNLYKTEVRRMLFEGAKKTWKDPVPPTVIEQGALILKCTDRQNLVKILNEYVNS